MGKHWQKNPEKDKFDNSEAIVKNRPTGRSIALEVLAKAKKQEARKLARGYKYVEVGANPLTLALKHPSEL